MPEIREISFFIWFINYFIWLCSTLGSSLGLVDIWTDVLKDELAAGTVQDQEGRAGHVFRLNHTYRHLERGNSPIYRPWPGSDVLPGMAKSSDWSKENLVLKRALKHCRVICLDFGSVIFRVS